MFMIDDLWHGRFTPSERGIRSGVRLMLDVVGEYHSDLPMMGECV